jgi:hypothetical protein
MIGPDLASATHELEIMDEKVLGALITGGLGLVAALVALGGVHSLRSQMSLGFLKDRMVAYRKLWSLTRPFSLTEGKDLTPSVRARADLLLREWYFDGGGALLLSKKSHGKLLEAWADLRECDDDEQVRRSFSALRTHLKSDLRVHGRLRDRAGSRSSKRLVPPRPETWPGG